MIRKISAQAVKHKEGDILHHTDTLVQSLIFLIYSFAAVVDFTGLRHSISVLNMPFVFVLTKLYLGTVTQLLCHIVILAIDWNV